MPAVDGCPKCGRSDFSSGSGKTLHIKSCKGPPPIVHDHCPKCGRSEFSSGSGKTLHIKACKGGEKQEKLEEPCPKCGSYDFNSLSGRTLHIKSCNPNKGITDKAIEPPKEIQKKNYFCPYCNKDIFGYERTFIHHLDECYPIMKNTDGHIFDKKLKVWVTKAPSKCHAPSETLKLFKCGPPKLGLFMLEHHDARGQMGCWLEGIGQCIYSYDHKMQRKISSPAGDELRISGEMTQT